VCGVCVWCVLCVCGVYVVCVRPSVHMEELSSHGTNF